MENTNIVNGGQQRPVQQFQQGQPMQRVQTGAINNVQRVQQGIQQANVAQPRMTNQGNIGVNRGGQGQYSQVSGFAKNGVNGIQGQPPTQYRVQPQMNNQFNNPQNVIQNRTGNINQVRKTGVFNGVENKMPQGGQYSQVSGFVGTNSNMVQNKMQNGAQVSTQQSNIKPNTGNTAGTTENKTTNQFFTKLFSPTQPQQTQQQTPKPQLQQQPQQMSGYTGGYVEQPSEKVLRIGINNDETATANLPAVKVGFLKKVKEFLLPSTWTLPEIRINVSEKEEKVLCEVHDFLFQEVSLKGFLNLLNFGKNKNNG